MKVDVYNKSGKKTSKKVDLNKKVFAVKPSEHSIYLAVKSELAANRQGTSSSKNRAAVRGGGTKPWKQKGTGRARIGSLRNPSRVHGGTAFGPEPRQYNLKVNKKVRNLARRSALSIKVSSKDFMVLDNFENLTNKTKDFSKILDLFKINDKKILVLYSNNNKNLYLSSRNLKNVNTINVNNSLSTYDLMNSNFLLIDKEGVNHLNDSLENN